MKKCTNIIYTTLRKLSVVVAEVKFRRTSVGDRVLVFGVLDSDNCGEWRGTYPLRNGR